MQCNHHFLQRLVPELKEKLKGTTLIEVFTQEKDEVILAFAAEHTEFYLRIAIGSLPYCIGTPSFARAKKNTFNLFTECWGTNFETIKVFENERAISIHLSSAYQFVITFFGAHANIYLFQQEDFLSSFHSTAFKGKPIDFHRPIERNEAIVNASNSPLQYYPTLGKIGVETIKEESKEINFHSIQNLLKKWESSDLYLINWKNKLHLSLSPLGKVEKTLSSALEAIHQWHRLYLSRQFFQSTTQSIEKRALTQLKKEEKKQQQLNRRLEQLKTGLSWEQKANLLMANLHLCQTGENSIELFDFYNNNTIQLKLNAKLSPADNAQNWYKKHKNQHKETDELKRKLSEGQSIIKKNKIILKELKELKTTSNLKQFLKKNPQLKPQEEEEKTKESLFKTFTKEGYTILVGKNAKNNDLLTTQYAHKNDLWLHAKDVSGSHVVIKQISGREIPPQVLEFAAALAAYYSKRKTEGIVPVLYTPKKYVRKVKGAAPGAVRVEKESVLLVEPWAGQ